jgi:hypothetical protein
VLAPRLLNQGVKAFCAQLDEAVGAKQHKARCPGREVGCETGVSIIYFSFPFLSFFVYTPAYQKPADESNLADGNKPIGVAET